MNHLKIIKFIILNPVKPDNEYLFLIIPENTSPERLHK